MDFSQYEHSGLTHTVHRKGEKGKPVYLYLLSKPRFNGICQQRRNQITTYPDMREHKKENKTGKKRKRVR
ncbi:hypothetical protein [Methanosarcina sp. 2.H.A.1B.4]|uniref:hypothetical protein n=1 Tax=Methanosarcina sp. 2.H.A.1B.4 TaxID=1483600 RepID=UPI000620ECBD|nr:hypothetical protein [Methanosarcina sp. 2.H.A.1B.4]KKG11061.1 hypothetical protein EO92_09250 [Methanosarcina sp. 2.H.A.1B.4]